jgi:hypothetical protein
MDRKPEEETMVELSATTATPGAALRRTRSRPLAYGTCLNRTRRGRADLITA